MKNIKPGQILIAIKDDYMTDVKDDIGNSRQFCKKGNKYKIKRLSASRDGFYIDSDYTTDHFFRFDCINPNHEDYIFEELTTLRKNKLNIIK